MTCRFINKDIIMVQLEDYFWDIYIDVILAKTEANFMVVIHRLDT